MAKIKCNVISYTLMRTVEIEIVLPTVTIPESLMKAGDIHHEYPAKFPVVYLLHGFGNNQSQWTGYTNVELYAEERQIAIVMISGENKNYIDMGNDLFEKFIEDELPEFICNTFPISNKKEDSFIAGLSMGGFGALYHGILNSNKYNAIGAFSPAVRMQNNPINIFEVLEKAKEAPKMFIACGEEDFVYKDVKDFVNKIKEKEFDLTWISADGYEHEWRFWNICIEKFLDWIERTDYYSNKIRKI